MLIILLPASPVSEEDKICFAVTGEADSQYYHLIFLMADGEKITIQSLAYKVH